VSAILILKFDIFGGTKNLVSRSHEAAFVLSITYILSSGV
jgi:hypothetical protein